jgi:hypothetical protein
VGGRAIALAAVAAAGGLLYLTTSGGGAADDSATYRHYFAIGEHLCQPPDPGSIGDITVWSGFTTATTKIPRTVPAEQRRALIAGCNAAVG